MPTVSDNKLLSSTYSDNTIRIVVLQIDLHGFVQGGPERFCLFIHTG